MADHTKTAGPDAGPEAGRTTEDAQDEPGQRAGSEEELAPPGKLEELDPELISLPRAPSGRMGPLMAISVIVFCVYIMFRLSGDLQFSRASDEPRPFDAAAELLAQAPFEELVQLPAVPDRTFALNVAHSQADDGNRLIPVQGTDGRLWVMVDGSVWTAGVQYREVYEGRMRRIADLPFARALEAGVRDHAPVPRFVAPDQVRAALAAGEPRVREPAGDMLTVAADTLVHVYETVADHARIEVSATDRHPRERDWTAALAETGLVPADAAPAPGPGDSWIYIAQVPGGADAARDRLRSARLFAASTSPIRNTHRATWGQLASQGEALLVSGQRVLWSNVDWVSVDVTRSLPDDALVLLTREQPSSYWYVTPLFGLLGLFTLLFLWALVRSLRRG